MLTVPPAVLLPVLGVLYMAFLDDPARPRPALIRLFAPLTVLGNTKDIAGAALFMVLDMGLWLAGLNALLTLTGWLTESPGER